jgi:hypothetical protein
MKKILSFIRNILLNFIGNIILLIFGNCKVEKTDIDINKDVYNNINSIDNIDIDIII